MRKIKLRFNYGRQTIALPRDIYLDADEVIITQQGNQLIITPLPKRTHSHVRLIPNASANPKLARPRRRGKPFALVVFD